MTFEQRLRVRRKQDHQSSLFSWIDTFAALNISSTLLIIVLVAMPTPHHGKSVDLARAANSVSMPNSLREDSMRISITRSGHVFFHTATVSPIDLSNLIRDDLSKSAEHKVYLAVDARAKYGDVSSVLDQIRETKILNLAILTESRPQHAETPQN
jgi:biopolymer transport protein ExbD